MEGNLMAFEIPIQILLTKKMKHCHKITWHLAASITQPHICVVWRGFLLSTLTYIYFATGHVRLCALQSKLIKCLLLSSLSSLSIASFLRGKQSVSHYIHAESPSLPYLYTLQIHMILVYCFCPGQYTWVMLSAHKIWQQFSTPVKLTSFYWFLFRPTIDTTFLSITNNLQLQ